MNGAESLSRTLVNQGVEVCFANPGTSEMHFVAALDKVEGMRCVLGLFEGVVTAAADGYYRLADKPACTLLHLGPGLGNGLANLHNAKKAGSGVVNVVGEHATYHIEHNAPLTSDIEGVARLPDLQVFAAEHGLKIGTIADLIAYRSRNESLVHKVGSKPLKTAYGEFVAHAYRDLPSQGIHLALVKGQPASHQVVRSPYRKRARSTLASTPTEHTMQNSTKPRSMLHPLSRRSR